MQPQKPSLPRTKPRGPGSTLHEATQSNVAYRLGTGGFELSLDTGSSLSAAMS